MSEQSIKLDPEQCLAKAHVAPEVFELRPDYRALLMIATNIPPGPSDTQSEEILASAEDAAKAILATTPLNKNPHVVAWRETYKAFGAKPKKTKNSLEALLSRVDAGLPRINRLTDMYNAISIKHQIPIGGEDWDKYQGAPVLVRAKGDEKFITRSGGEDITDYPKEGEVIWRDDDSVTCRAFNWRQCVRTALTNDTTSVLFILDALDAISDDELMKAADELETHVRSLGGDVKVWRRLIDGDH